MGPYARYHDIIKEAFLRVMIPNSTRALSRELSVDLPANRPHQPFLVVPLPTDDFGIEVYDVARHLARKFIWGKLAIYV